MSRERKIPTAALELRDLSVRYPARGLPLTAVDGVNLIVPKRATLGLVGESGCGKSSLARAIVGLAPIVRGRLLLDGVDYTHRRELTSREFRRRVQLIFQDPYSSLNPRMTIGEMIGEGLAIRGELRKAEVMRILNLVGLPSASLERYPHQFSGGQRQRIAIARVLAVGPEVIICDEVSSGLDVSVQAIILNLLRRLQHELGLSYLFISHDLATVRFMSDVISVMYLGRIVETAPTDRLFLESEHPYTKALLASVPEVGAQHRPAPLTGEIPNPRRPPTGCRFHTRCPVGPMAFPDRTVCIVVDPQVIASTRKYEAACHFASIRPATGREWVG